MPNQGVLVGAEDLDTYTINNFAPGIITGADNISQYSTEAPLGSASKAFRCYSRPGLGLRPFPTYTPILNGGNPTFTHTNAPATNTFLSICDLAVFPAAYRYGTFPADEIAVSILVWTGTNTEFAITDFIVPSTGPPTINNIFLDNTTAEPLFHLIWPNLAKSFIVQSSLPSPVVFSSDPSNGTWDSEWVVSGGTSNIMGHGLQDQVVTAFVTDRFTILGSGVNVGGLGQALVVTTSDLQSPTNFTAAEYFEPELGSSIGSWGTVSTGEFVIIFQSGGAVVIYGDIQAPQQAIYLPAVTGTGQAVGPAVSSPVGLVYVTDTDGAWVWNGGNVSQKISTQIPDTLLYRIPPTILWQVGPPLQNWFATSIGSVRADVWGNWVMFSNNYFFDCLNNSWWQCEDPTVLNFDIHSGGSYTGRFFYSIPNTILTSTNGGTLSTSLYRWDHSAPANSYFWQSNPIPTPGSVSRLQRIEIVASNTTSSPATISITPTSPPNQSLYGNQTPSSVTFTIPPNTASYRNSQQVGYTDYNICIAVTATGGNNTSAPTIHEITCGFDRSTSRVSQ
jgi:hypothetical protein